MHPCEQYVMNRCIDTFHNNVGDITVFFAPHVLMDVAHLLHFTDDDIGFVIKVRNGGGGAKVAFRIC